MSLVMREGKEMAGQVKLMLGEPDCFSDKMDVATVIAADSVYIL